MPCSVPGLQPQVQMQPDAFLGRHVQRRHAAIAAAAALRDGDDEPARALLADTWLRAGAPVDRALLGRLAADAPPVAQETCAALLGEPPRPDHPCLAAGSIAERCRLRRLLEHGVPGAAPRDDLACDLYLLSFLGAEVDRVERAAWREARFPADPELDERARAWWILWFQLPSDRVVAGRRALPALGPAGWAELLHGWKALFRPHALRAYRGVLEHVNCPARFRRHHLAELREASFARLCGGEGPYLGWVELAARVVERGGNGQIEALGTLCDGSALRRVAGCAAQRGSLAVTLRDLYPEVDDPVLRALGLVQALLGAADRLDALLDAHVAFRLTEAWTADPRDGLDRGWRVVRQNRGRAAARLRAIVAEGCVESLSARLLALPALHARTASAVRAYFWAWGLDLITHASGALQPGARVWSDGGFTDLDGAEGLTDPGSGLSTGGAVDFCYDSDRDVTPACRGDGDLPPPLAPEEQRALRAWVLLVILRGRLRQLLRWAATGGGDKDGGWGRLLADELPAVLRDAGAVGRSRGGYRRLRLALATALPELCAEVSPAVAEVAALRPGRAVPTAVQALLAPLWHPAVRFPASGFPSMLRHARESLDLLTQPGDTP